MLASAVANADILLWSVPFFYIEGLSDEELAHGVKTAYDKGWSQVKLYFMIVRELSLSLSRFFSLSLSPCFYRFLFFSRVHWS